MRRIVAPRRRAGCAAITIASAVVLRDEAAVLNEQDARRLPGQPLSLGTTCAVANTRAGWGDRPTSPGRLFT